MSSARTAFLALLLAILSVVSCATAFEKRTAPAPTTQAARSPDRKDPLATRKLLIPVTGVRREGLRDTFHDLRGKRTHKALDIMAQRGTPVIAAGDGRVAKIYRHPLGGLCVYQYDADVEHVYYYAHLDAFAKGLAEGAMLRRGDPIGYVGTTGNASPTAPHLHFSLIRLGAEKKWYKGTPVNPFPYLVDDDS